MVPAAAGRGFTLTKMAVETDPVLQGLEGVTVTFPFPALAATVTVIALLPEPDVMEKPEGSVQA